MDDDDYWYPDDWEYWESPPYVGVIEQNSDPDVIGSRGWNPSKQISMDDEISVEVDSNGNVSSSGLGDWWQSLSNSIGSALGNVGGNVLNAASQNANQAIAKKYGTTTTNQNGTQNTAGNQQTVVILAGAVLVGVVLWLALKKSG